MNSKMKPFSPNVSDNSDCSIKCKYIYTNIYFQNVHPEILAKLQDGARCYLECLSHSHAMRT